ncbi:MAG: hypothetical protein IMZ62_00805 [Chloroflexi bacterium]|nr:hypothetical protein [Chloroflexota bacterium]
MAKTAKQKQSYGSCSVDHFSPPPQAGWPPAVKIVLGFEDAMKLQLALQARLLDMNRLNRSTREGKTAAVNLCVHVGIRRITVNPDRTQA